MFQFKIPKKKLDELLKIEAVHSPDFIIYDFQEDNYRTFWEQAKNHSRDKFTTNGLAIAPISETFRKLESFLSYFSGSYYCQINRTEMVLAKIAYHGYLKGFNKKTDWQLTTKLPLISKEFSERILNPREDKNTEALQKILMDYAKTHIKYFYDFSKYVKNDYHFGFALTNNDLFEFVPSIDLQNTKFALSVADYILRFDKKVEKPAHFSTSIFQEIYAQCLVNNKHYEEALNWSPTIATQFSKAYIKYYLSNRNNKHKAIALIDQCYQGREDEKQVLLNIIQSFTAEYCITHFKNYTKIKELVIRHYFDSTQNGICSSGLTKEFYDFSYKPFMTQLFRLDRHMIESTLLKEHHEAYAKFLVTLEQFDLATQWSTIIETQFKKEYIDYYLASTTQNKAKALALIASLHQEQKNTPETLHLILNHYSIEEQAEHLKKFKPLQDIVISHYFALAQKEKGSNNLITQLSHIIWGNKYRTYIDNIFMIDPNITENPLLINHKEELILYQFDKITERNEYKQAWQLFCKHTQSSFPAEKLLTLHQYGEKEFAEHIKLIHRWSGEGNYKQAITLADENITLAKNLVRISNDSSHCIKATVLHAQLILEQDLHQRSKKDADITGLLQEQQELIELSLLTSKPTIHDTCNKITLRIINILIESNKVELGYRALQDEINERNKPVREELKKQLKLFIQYNQSSHEPEIRNNLAKMNFILGDVLYFFESKKDESLIYFKNALQLVPQNPYYGICCNELKVPGIPDYLEKIPPDQRFRARIMYGCWKEVRWDEDQELIAGFDIHNTIMKEEDNLLSTLFHFITKK